MSPACHIVRRRLRGSSEAPLGPFEAHAARCLGCQAARVRARRLERGMASLHLRVDPAPAELLTRVVTEAEAAHHRDDSVVVPAPRLRRMRTAVATAAAGAAGAVAGGVAVAMWKRTQSTA